ncbi:hypothetical protein BU24DRAFT_422450 [Aaosphaeria arxii CBS 175.79]|uniref:EthD domain-containing protein n=1 Tax=Aaosphaeria arxii CBS 175.79 TaxID=1450172 RepID=A0A6A5XT40_9PLEO|nr:uncharacterized protein BU24DRAFT_422450 [Aaosphaeria arxii CBS 175.79]KAF2016113.1 hypothetical protein BU24DRAFT_422450 [Aaosphaeria arxii CBS 175.79]
MSYWRDMPYTIVIFLSRKPGLSLSTFQNDYETVHIPLLKKVVGDEFPLSHTRHYVDRTDAKARQDDDYLFVSQDSFEYDVVTVYTFANRAHWMRFLERCESNLNIGRLKESENRLIREDGIRMIRMGDTRSTGKNGGEVGWQFVGESPLST